MEMSLEDDEEEDATYPRRAAKKGRKVKKYRKVKKSTNIPRLRHDNRPFVGLTQVCRQIRNEYRPLHLAQHEVGVDLTNAVKYMKTFYPDADEQLESLLPANVRDSYENQDKDIQYTGNITIALGKDATKLESHPDGIDILHVLDIWANSYRVETGFGRYRMGFYDGQRDGEAKDL